MTVLGCFCRPSRFSERPLFHFFWRHHPTPGAHLTALRSQIAHLCPRFGLGIPTPMPGRTSSLRATLEHSEIPEIQFSQIFGGAPVEPISGLGSGSVREILGYDFGNSLIVFGFTNEFAQIRGKIPGVSFGDSSGETPIGKRHRSNPLRFFNLKGQSREVPCIFSPLLYRLSYLGLECGSAY